MFYKELAISNKLTLYDSQIQKISMYSQNDSVEIEIILKLKYPQNIYLKMLFQNVSDYFFSWNDDYIFETVESYKLLTTDKNIYYCSFDPADRDCSISTEDRDFIFCKKLEGYIFCKEEPNAQDEVYFEIKEN